MRPLDLKELGKYKSNALNVLVICVSLIVAYNIYKNQSKNMQALKEKGELEVKKNEVLGKISQSEKVFNAYKNYLNKKDMSLLINTIGNLAKEANVKILAIKPIMEEKSPVYTRYPFDLTVGATDYHAIGRFISKIESHPDIYFVDRLTMRQKDVTGDAEQKYNLVADMTVTTIMLNK